MSQSSKNTQEIPSTLLGKTPIESLLVTPDGTEGSVLAITHDILAVKNLQQELLFREHIFRTLAENSPNIIMRYDNECKRIYVNPAYAEQTGIPRDQALQTTPTAQWKMYLNMLTISADEYQKKVLHVIQTGESTQLLVEWERYSDHQRVSHDLHIVPEKDVQGNIIGALAIGHNITTYRKQKAILKTKELEFRTLAENLPDAVVRYDQNLKRTYVNMAWESVNNILRDEVLGKSPMEKAGRITDKANEFEAMLQRVLNTGKSEEFELDWKNKEGKVFFFNFHSVAEYDGTGNIISVLTIALDITSYKELEKALSSKEQLFRALAENSPDAIIRYDTSCRKIYLNRMAVKTFGRSASELLGETPTEATLIVNDKEFELKLQEVIRSKQEATIEVSTLSSEEQVWAEVRLIPEFDNHGELISVLAVGRHITERKQLEMHLNTTLSQFEQFINNITEMAWIKDKQSRYIIVNQVLANRFGVRVDDMIGKQDADFFDERTSRAHVEVDFQVMREGISLKVEEMISLNPDNEQWIESIKNPFKDSNGEIIGTIGTARDITERKHFEKQMAFMAHHDTLTNLPNRALAKDRAEQAIAHAKRNESKVALLFIDLDGFKTINDSLGHAFGDMMLKMVANRLKKHIRQTDTLSRQGGDEFLMMLTDVYDVEDVSSVAQKFLSEFEKPFQLDTHSLSSSISIGIALYPDDGKHFEALLQCADTAMYKAKEAGRNTYCFFTEAMNQEIFEHLHIQNDLKQAIAQQEFVLHYQPQIDLATNTISGVEALLRWNHPANGLVPPMKFIPIAESSGLILEIGAWVINEACRQAKRWHKQGINITMAVNISAVQFKRGNLEQVIEKALESSGFNPQYLELELTESILIHDTENILQSIKRLKSLGVRLSIDDFGTGYSSLSYLKRFAVDKLKIDKSFVQDILKDQEDAIIVGAIIQMAKSLNLKTIAEGVETKEVSEIIKSHGCDEVQGYYFAKPMCAEDFVHYFSQREFTV